MTRAPAFEPTRAGAARLLGRLSRSALALLCVGALADCGAAAGHHSGPVAPPRPPGRVTATGGYPQPTEEPPVLVLAVTAPEPAVPTAAGTAGTAAAQTPAAPTTASGGARSGAPRTRRRTPPSARRQPAPRPPGVCDLGELYGRWSPGSAQDAACRAVYG